MFYSTGTEAIVTTAITKIVEKKEKKEICSCETEGAVEAVKEEKVLPFSRKLRWLNNMLGEEQLYLHSSMYGMEKLLLSFHS